MRATVQAAYRSNPVVFRLLVFTAVVSWVCTLLSALEHFLVGIVAFGVIASLSVGALAAILVFAWGEPVTKRRGQR